MYYNIVENVNGDICFFNRVVDVYDLNIIIWFFYNGLKGLVFIFYDICIDGFGNIIIVENINKIYILNINGSFLNILIVFGLNVYE